MLDKLKQLSKDTAIYGISTILGRFINFLLVPFYTNIFIPAEYGIIAHVYAYIAVLAIIYLYGMEAAFLKYASTKEWGSDKENFSVPFLSVFITSIIFSTFFILLNAPLSDAFKLPAELSHIIYYVALILFLDTIGMIPFAYLRLARRAKSFALIKFLNILINVTLNIVLILQFEMGIEAVFISNIAASLFSLLALLPTIIKNIKFSFNRNLLNKLLRFGLPYLPAGLATVMIQVIDRPILKYLTDSSTLGIYQANYKLGIFMMLFVSMFQYAWQPFFLQHAKDQRAKELFSKILTYFVLSGITLTVIISLFIEDIVSLNIGGRYLIGQDYWGGLFIVPVILLAYVFNGMYVNFTAGIYIEEKTSYVPLVTGFGAIANIILNFLLIPVIGIMGAALATLGSYIIMAAGLYRVSQKFYRVNYEWKKIGFIFLTFIITGSFYYFVINYLTMFIIYKIIILLFFIFMIFLFKIINKYEFINLLKSFIKK